MTNTAQTCASCGNCFAWERIDEAWGLCVTDDVETRVDDICDCHTPHTPGDPA